MNDRVGTVVLIREVCGRRLVAKLILTPADRIALFRDDFGRVLGLRVQHADGTTRNYPCE